MSHTPADFRPPGYTAVSPYLLVEDAPALIDFLTSALGATLVARHDAPEGGIMHASMRLHDAMIEVSDACPAWPSRQAAVHVYVSDVDAACRRAVQAGATLLQPVEDKPYGERACALQDRWGNHWYVATALPVQPVRDTPA
ncbi:VOC family protein [Caldimonas brevitalea]|uniref:VOC domain-containing protein n=1 Tax=Caldimonas brevitalea TaxID=413882 RepID=A0A0G3BRI5_9BURK|nr:VOC family protein [Caldimonas brevitalea]AKJ32027.1 hypothetical protein AAW51_5336 [Caldimonas brevitalea]